MSAPFVHLHTHSHYSLLHALPTPTALAGAAKADGMPALALTDNGALYGAIDFYKACTKEGVKPIIGIDAYLAPRTRHDKDAGIDKPRARLVLLAKNNNGYRQLIKMVTEAHCTGFYYRPRIDRELIQTLRHDLVCIIPSFSGETSLALKENDTEGAGAALDWYKSVFAADCYLEITHHPEISGHNTLQENIRQLAARGGVPLVAAHDVYYLAKGDRLAREVVVRIQNGKQIDLSQFDEEGSDFSFITQNTAREYFKDMQEALANTARIAEECTVTMNPGGTWYFPDYVIESGKTPDQELADMVYRGVSWRGLSLENAEVKERLAYELSIIKMKEYSTYFLVVADLISQARARGILTTIRGSVAGSLVTYVIGITTVNPLEYRLPFERFLNPERPSAPDIDMDFADDRRDEIIEYARKKYGSDKVAQIGTFGTMMARAAVRDVARALGHPYALGDTIAKLIPIGSQGFPMSIARAMQITPELSALYNKEQDVKEVVDLAKKIEGNVRHVGVHAAGVVIAPEPLERFVPLQPDPKTGKFITQYEMHSVGEDGVGLLKFDFLGITNLAILSDTIQRVEERQGVSIDIEDIPLDDKKTFDMLARGETMGLFQLNGSGITTFLKQLQPSSIHDINAMVALYRPGPMDSIPQYIERKHNPHLVRYLDPRLSRILDRSYGVVTYQDDVLLIARELAGYSWLEADMLRKAMGKKIPKVMAAEKEKLLKGFETHGTLSRTLAERLWKLIEPFAAYGFNKAHAASYGRVAYQTAYMKANYPIEYMAAVLTADTGNAEKIAETIHECTRMGIEVLPPDINQSVIGFSVVTTQEKGAHIRFGLLTIKNFGEGVARALIDERERDGAFTSLANLLERVAHHALNKKSLEALIMSGALDRFENRGIMLHNLDILLAYNREISQGKSSQQISLFSGSALEHTTALSLAPAATEPPPHHLLQWEKELLGVYVSGHPLDAFKKELNARPSISSIKRDGRNGIPVITAGMVESMRELLTKKGERMAFVALSDKNDTIEMVVFPEAYRTYKALCTVGACIVVKGRLLVRNDEPSVALERAKQLGQQHNKKADQST